MANDATNIGSTDTIAAIATASGQGGVGIIRLSGPASASIAEKILGELPRPRYAQYGPFHASDNSVIDTGISLYFPRPHSFTGEDVVELQAHGGPVVLDMLLKLCVQHGARVARAGEFSERAFLNDKIDLAQAEAIADLIAADSEQAAIAATRSLQGVFSSKVAELVEQLIQLRVYIESALDFPEEEIDFLADDALAARIQQLETMLAALQNEVVQGRLLKEGMHVVIAGKPNAGKSSLLNSLAGGESAIVTDIPGTTRDILREHIQIDGLPLHIIDTAGLRESSDIVEQEGIRRAREAIKQADLVLYLTVNDHETPELHDVQDNKQKLVIVRNKIDLEDTQPCIEESESGATRIKLSVKTGAGVHLLRDYLKSFMGFQAGSESQFIARRRHVVAIEKAAEHVAAASSYMQQNREGELMAEEYRLAQQELASITGEFSSDDLLGRIFADFCIGK